jgi:rhodanese-related sulfurtransferase
VNQTQENVAGMIARAREQVENLTPTDAAREIEAGGVTVVDLREPAELDATGSIAGAVNVPRGMLEFRADASSPYHLEEFDPGQRVILYCASGGRSALAAETLQRMGYGKVAHVDGGFKAWSEQFAS